MKETWRYEKRGRMPDGSGQGWILRGPKGLTLCIAFLSCGLITAEEAVDWANMFVRILDDEQLAWMNEDRNGA